MTTEKFDRFFGGSVTCKALFQVGHLFGDGFGRVDRGYHLIWYGTDKPEIWHLPEQSRFMGCGAPRPMCNTLNSHGQMIGCRPSREFGKLFVDLTLSGIIGSGYHSKIYEIAEKLYYWPEIPKWIIEDSELKRRPADGYGSANTLLPVPEFSLPFTPPSEELLARVSGGDLPKIPI